MARNEQTQDWNQHSRNNKTKNKVQRINEPNCFLEKINKIDKPLSQGI